MNDLTILYYTANFISKHFELNTQKQLLLAIKDIPLISISQKPMNLGKNICVGDIGRSTFNIYKQALIGAKAAETDYVAMCEDDILYSSSHFEHRPSSKNVFAYNMNRWGIFTWSNPPVFSYKHRIVFSQLIAPRKLLIEALEERFNKYPDGKGCKEKYFAEPGKYEIHLGVTIRNWEEFKSKEPNVMFSHKEALGYLSLGERKRLGDEKINFLDPWGSAEQVLSLYKEPQ